MYFDITGLLCSPLHFILYMREHSEQGSVVSNGLPKPSGHKKGQGGVCRRSGLLEPWGGKGRKVAPGWQEQISWEERGTMRLDRSQGPHTEGS